MKKTQKTLALNLALILGLLLGLISPSAMALRADDTIKLGFIGPLSGATAVYGNATKNGVQLAMDEINEAGGVLGKKVEVIFYDDKDEVQESLNAYNRLRDEGIVGLVGAVTSKPSMVVAPRAQEDKMPMITPTGTAVAITEAGDYVFRPCFLDADQGNLMAEFIKEKLGLSKVAIIHNNADEYSVGLAEAFETKAKELGLEITAVETYGEADIDFKPQLTKISQTQPEALYIPDYYGKDILINNQAKELGLDIPYLGGDGWDGVLEVVSKESPDEADGVIFTNHYANDDDAEVVQKFMKGYQEAFDADPVSFAALGYDAMNIMCKAIEAAGSTEPEAIRDAMAATEYEGVTGNITFDEKGNPLKEILFIEIKDGAYTLRDKMEITERP